jgi:hypothetical protein
MIAFSYIFRFRRNLVLLRHNTSLTFFVESLRLIAGSRWVGHDFGAEQLGRDLVWGWGRRTSGTASPFWQVGDTAVAYRYFFAARRSGVSSFFRQTRVWPGGEIPRTFMTPLYGQSYAI